MNARPIVAALALGTLSTGCVDNMASIEIFALCAPPDNADTCSFTATCGAQTLVPPAMDITMTNRAWFFVEVHNQNVDNSDPATGRANTNNASILEYVTTYEAPGFPVTLPEVRYAVGPFSVPAEGTSVASFFPIEETTAARLVAGWPGALAEQLVITRTRARGIYGNQSEFETAAYEVPIRVCNGGCISVPDCDPATPGIEPFIACPQVGQYPVSYACP